MGTSTLNTPKMRFPEFDGKLQASLLGEIASFSKGKGISKADIAYDGQTECIRYGELYTEYGETISEIVSKTNISTNELVLSEFNDVIIPASGETSIDIATASCVLKDGVALGGDLNIIKSELNGVYLSYYLNTAKKLDIANLAQGNSVVHLYPSQLRTLKINFPEKTEQQKIASFLTSIDIKIQHLTKKKTLLEKYKKGVMQKIFSQEIRFKDENGKEFSKWEEKILGDVGEIIGGGTPDTAISKYWGGEIDWFTPTEIKSKYIDKSLRTLTESGIKNSSAKILPKGTILLSTRATIGDMGIALNECSTNQGFQSIVVNDQNNNEFVYYWLIVSKNQLLRLAKGSTFLELNKTELSNIDIALPSKEEQTKIANFLSALDTKIEHTYTRIEKTKLWKKGLLQQLFV